MSWSVGIQKRPDWDHELFRSLKGYAFSKDDDAIRINTPGKIYFCANDVATSEGVKKAESFVQGIPIQPAKDANGSGYQDNDGIIKVRVAVGKSKKEGDSKK